jgi:hypothetical protein
MLSQVVSPRKKMNLCEPRRDPSGDPRDIASEKDPSARRTHRDLCFGRVPWRALCEEAVEAPPVGFFSSGTGRSRALGGTNTEAARRGPSSGEYCCVIALKPDPRVNRTA